MPAYPIEPTAQLTPLAQLRSACAGQNPVAPPGVGVGVQVGVIVPELDLELEGREAPIEKVTAAIMPRPVTLVSEDHAMVR